MWAPVPYDDIATAEADEFRCSQSCLQGQDENDMVPMRDPCGAVGRCQQRIHLRTIQELNRSSHIALARHGQDSLAVKHVSGLALGHDRKKDRITARRALRLRALLLRSLST